MLIDSDVLIWSMRGHAGAVNLLSTIYPLRMSVVTYMELAQGCRNKTELKQFKKALQLCKAIIEPLDEATSALAAQLIDTYALTHSLRVADALIAATAISRSLILLTGNGKHFSKIDGLSLQVFTP